MALADTAKLIVQMDLQGNAVRGLQQFDKQLTSLNRGGLSQMSRGVGKVGSGLSTLGTRAAVAATAGLTAVVTTAASFEQAFAGVLKTTGATGKEAATLRQEFEELSRVTPVSFEDLSAIGEMGGALGIANEDLDEFTDLVARLGVSTDLSFEGAADAVGKLRNVLHLNNEEMFDLADAVVALGNAGASTESQIIGITQRFAAAAQSAGLTVDATVALASTVASLGIEEEAGGSALSRIFNSVATNIGTANDKATAFADGLGLSLAEFRAAWENDAEGVFQDLLEHLNELDQFEAAAFLKDIGITNTRDINALRLLAQGHEEYRRQLDVTARKQGAVRKESDAFFNTTSGKFKIFTNNVKLAADEIGAELLPVLNDAMEEFVGWLNKASTQKGIKNFAKDLAQGARDFIAAVKAGELDGVIDGLKGAAEVAKTAFEAFQALPGPVKALALAALVGNKVTGGAIGQIAGGLKDIFSGAIKLAFERGSPTNPMYVVPVGGGLGGGPGGVGGRGGGLLGGLKTLGALASIPLAVEAGRRTVEAIEGAKDLGQDIRDRLDKIDTSTLKGATERLQTIDASVKDVEDNAIANFFGLDNRLRDGFAEERANLTRQIGILNADEGRRFSQGSGQLAAQHQARLNAINTLNANEGTRAAAAQARLQEIRGAQNTANAHLDAIKRKPTSFRTNVTVNNNIGVEFSATAVAIQLRRVTQSGGNQQDFEAVG